MPADEFCSTRDVIFEPDTAGISRFRSRGAFAMNNRTAPVPVWSGNFQRHRLNRGGNRQLNVALHRIAVTR
jgi:transposase